MRLKFVKLVVLAIAAMGLALANPELLNLQQDRGQWVMSGKTYDGLRYSPLSHIALELLAGFAS